MKITEHGDKKYDRRPEEFKCRNCGCEFTADGDEYYLKKGLPCNSLSTTSLVYQATVVDTYVCSCPECHKIVIKEKNRDIDSPTITLNAVEAKPI